ncbi:MAG TPA: hypothetical protein VJ898_09775 [Natrialbaceae archaeon]|nr:hypothetical protein [Natrialbaceae archaeon]
MPIHSPWRPASSDHIGLNVPNEPGVYELKSFGKLVYIGTADDLEAALLDRLDERSPNYYRVQTPELLESVDDLYEQHLHRYEREHDGLPTWNESEDEGDGETTDDDEEASAGGEDEETTASEGEPAEDETTEQADSAQADDEGTADDEPEEDETVEEDTEDPGDEAGVAAADEAE